MLAIINVVSCGAVSSAKLENCQSFIRMGRNFSRYTDTYLLSTVKEHPLLQSGFLTIFGLCIIFNLIRTGKEWVILSI